MSGNKISSVLLLIFIFSSSALSLNLKYASDPCINGFYVATQGGFYGNWNTKLRFPFEENFTFRAIGNDIYLAVFEDQNPKPTDVLIISGYGNTRTTFSDNGTVRGEVCSVPMSIENLSISNTFRVETDVEKHTISLWYNGIKYLSCAKSKLKEAMK